jgi:PIN domain nuclease of toxin-antitoxin system
MTRVVLDASALRALLLNEPGAEQVKSALDDAVVGVVNLAEVVSHYAKLGASREDIEVMLRPLSLSLAPVDTALSFEAGMLRTATLPRGLSLGDRYCLALAKREGAPAMTAERQWPPIAGACGVEVVLIR